MTEEQEKFLKSLITTPRSMQGDYAVLIKVDGTEEYLSPKIGENYTREDVSGMIGAGFRKISLDNCLLVYRNTIAKTSINYNQQASRIANFDIYGDAIYAPSEFFDL